MSPVLFWFLLGLVFLGVELFNPAMVLLFFGAGALAASAVAGAGASVPVQTGTFIAVSLITLITLRRAVRRVFLGRSQVQAEDQGPARPGETAVVVTAPGPDGVGQVRLHGSIWDCRLPTGTEPGRAVTLDGMDGSMLTGRVLPPTQDPGSGPDHR